MQRARGGGMRGFGGGQAQTSTVKSRLGFQPRGGGRGGARGGGGGLGGRLGVVTGGRVVGGAGGSIKSRLGPGAKKRSVAAVAIGEIIDARQKINLNKVQTGRIGDARQKIEAKRRKTAIVSGKISNLKITTEAASEMMMRGAAGYTSRGEREALSNQGLFRSAVEHAVSQVLQNQSRSRSPRLTRTIGGGGYPAGVRIAPPADDYMLTRTISNPTARYTGGRDLRKSPLQASKMAPNSQYNSYGRGLPQDQPMDEDDYDPLPPRRIDSYQTSAGGSTSECRIWVSNLQPSVTADDIVELFSDIGPLVSARMSATGQAEVTYTRKSDALKAIEAYHNRLLDGSAMRVFLDAANTRTGSAVGASSTGLKSASGASMKLPKSASGIKIQPDISAIHKVLFNPSSSATRGLFKGGQ